MTEWKQNRGSFALPLVALTTLGALGALSLLLTAETALQDVPPEQIAAAGGPNALKVAIVIQPIVLAIMAGAIGLLLAHKVGLRSCIADRLRGQTAPRVPLMLSLVAGAAVGALIIAADLIFVWAQPIAFSSLRAAEVDPPLALFQGVLYGGFTEEILVRWGLLSLIAWVLVKLRLPVNIALWLAVLATALLFAAGHLPALAAISELNLSLVIRTLLLNAIGGIAFGMLFVRHNLEAAMLAHMVSHLTFFVARLAGGM
jgi:hypothetical protein